MLLINNNIFYNIHIIGNLKNFIDKIPENTRCNFEYGWCGWTNVPKRPLNWTLHKGPTSSEKIGPSYDHTYRNKTGVLFFELDLTKKNMIQSQNNKLFNLILKLINKFIKIFVCNKFYQFDRNVCILKFGTKTWCRIWQSRHYR